MVLSVRYGAASADIASESFDGEFVVLDLSCGKYFSFSDSGSMLWEAVLAGVVPGTLLARAPETVASGVESFVGKLLEYGLVAPQPNVPPVDASNELLARLAAAKEAPEIVAFDDLADLFLADPIHDVEEWTGWPEVRPT